MKRFLSSVKQRIESLKRDRRKAIATSRSGWTPFDGFEAKAWPIATIIRGRTVMREDEVVAPGLGQPMRFLETL